MYKWISFGRRSRLVRLIIATVLITGLISTYRRKLAERLSVYLPGYIEPDDCSDYPDLDNVVVVVKTGATEAHRLIPTLLKTSLRCVKDPLVVSDLEQDIAGIKLHNVLAEFAPRAMQGNPDFDIYRLMQDYQAEGKENDITQLASMPLPNQNWRTSGKSAAWGLDKYKNIRMVELAWRLQPERQWYFFIDADTYVVWNSLLAWLATMDHSKPLYVGQPVRMKEHKPKPLDFAYGGAGILLSGEAVRIYAAERPGLTQRWDRRIQGWWFGDFMLADALDEELDLSVTDGTPMLAGDSPAVMAYGPHNWCRPVVSLHHLSPKDSKALYKVERAAGSSLLLAKDVYHGVPHGELPRLLVDWDNKATDGNFQLPIEPDLARLAHSSLTACEAACQGQSKCFQYMFVEKTDSSSSAAKQDSRCYLSSVFRLGEQRAAELTGDKKTIRKTWTSGWNIVRVLAWTMTNDDCGDVKGLWRFGPGVTVADTW